MHWGVERTHVGPRKGVFCFIHCRELFRRHRGSEGPRIEPAKPRLSAVTLSVVRLLPNREESFKSLCRHRILRMDSGGARITLDQESFRALASDVRVGILKRLDVRRETVTDLSNLLSLSKPTLLEHLEKLQSAGLVKRVDEGRKWIYYELSDKGRKILHPERVAITLALASAVVLAAIGAFLLFAVASPFQTGSPAFRNETLAPVASQ